MPKPFDPARARVTIFDALVAAAHRHGKNKVVLEDAERQPLTYGRLILASLVLGEAITRGSAPGEPIGVLLPNANGMVVTLFGLNAFGRTAVLLNFTAGLRNLQSAVKTAPIRTLITSRRFVDLAKLGDVVAGLAETETVPGHKLRVVYLEDVRKRISPFAKLRGALRAIRARRFHHRHAQRPEQPAVILFTSGTEGAPKGVALSNTNLVSNARQIYAHADGFFSPADTVLNPLPMFHSFGLTAAALMPILSGMKVVLYPSPLHYKQVVKLMSATRPTVLFATDTFLQGYKRAAEPGELDSIRYVIAGAERVKDATRAAWSNTGATVLEGYGVTECSPVVACNLPPRNTPGSVGLLLPGVETRLEPVSGIDGGGRLLVRGPNVMAGYMLHSAPGVLVPPRDGWHDTGDIVSIDDGLVRILGRAKRFAKIGGEMVSLAAVEAMASTVWPDAQHVVVAVSDERKGEQLVLVTDHKEADRSALVAAARSEGMTELYVPRSILVVPAIPVLGSGKVDLSSTQQLVNRMRSEPQAHASSQSAS